jgi:hypothetical protein
MTLWAQEGLPHYPPSRVASKATPQLGCYLLQECRSFLWPKTTGIPQEPGSSCSNQHAKQELHIAQYVFPVDIPADYWVTVTMALVKILPKKR